MFTCFVFSLSPLDNLVRAVLYLHQCEPDQAQAALCSIPKVTACSVWNVSQKQGSLLLSVLFPMTIFHFNFGHSFAGADPGGGGVVGWLATPSLRSFKLEIKKGNKTITEAIFFSVVLISVCQDSHRPFKNPGSATAVRLSQSPFLDVV